jgi:hypothetical protein
LNSSSLKSSENQVATTYSEKKHEKQRQSELVGGLEHVYMFHLFPFHIWDVILPIDFHIFQDG